MLPKNTELSKENKILKVMTGKIALVVLSPQNVTIPLLIHLQLFAIVLFFDYSSEVKCKKKAFPVVKERSCQTKKPAYKLKVPPGEVKSSHTHVSVKDKCLVSSPKTVEWKSSELFSVSSGVSQRPQAISQHSCDEKSHQRTASKVKTLLLSEREQKIQKIFGRARKLSRNEKSDKTKSISEKQMLQEKRKLWKDLSPRSLHSEAETSLVSFLSKEATSRTKTISNTIKNTSPVKSVLHKTAMLESPKQPVWSLEATPLPSFKIPKMVDRRPAETTAKTSISASSDRKSKHATELSKPDTVHHSHNKHDRSWILSCDTGNETSSSSSHLQDTSTTLTNTWQDEVMKCKFFNIVAVHRTILLSHTMTKKCNSILLTEEFKIYFCCIAFICRCKWLRSFISPALRNVWK